MYYPSQIKNTFVLQEHHKRICKAILQGVNVDKVIVDEMVAVKPSLVIKAVAGIIQQEVRVFANQALELYYGRKILMTFSPSAGKH